ncbi:MAG: VWA domain-containing protein [Planctomycetes bacterium]|nr:VWA domain-containing protein [Planctomycetota bacterium]
MLREPALDIAILLDTTGAMGAYAAHLARRLAATIAAVEARAGDVRLGAVAFKDHGAEGEDEAYLTRTLPLTPDRARALDFFASPALAPGVGGGGAEAVECALRAARGLRWREEARRVVVLVGDKPPHGAGLDALHACPEHVDYREEVEALARRGVALHAVHVGGHLVTGRVFEFMAARTGGACVALPHIRDLPQVVADLCLLPVAPARRRRPEPARPAPRRAAALAGALAAA